MPHGQTACPPEDCGGIWGYAGFLDAIQDPQHSEHEEMLEWVGGEFDQEAFDLDEVNRELQNLNYPEVRIRACLKSGTIVIRRFPGKMLLC